MTIKKDKYIDFEEKVTIDKTTGTILALGGLAILGGIISTSLLYYKAWYNPEARKRELLSQYDDLSKKVSKDELISSLANDFVERFYLKEYSIAKESKNGKGCTWIHFPKHNVETGTNNNTTTPQTIQSANLPAQKHIQFKEHVKD